MEYYDREGIEQSVAPFTDVSQARDDATQETALSRYAWLQGKEPTPEVLIELQELRDSADQNLPIEVHHSKS